MGVLGDRGLVNECGQAVLGWWPVAPAVQQAATAHLESPIPSPDMCPTTPESPPPPAPPYQDPLPQLQADPSAEAVLLWYGQGAHDCEPVSNPESAHESLCSLKFAAQV